MNIKFNDTNNILAGTLTLPKSDVKYGLILLHSSDRSHRDEDYFVALSEYLADFGIATLRYDSPGSGDSQGNAFLQSFVDRKNEALSAYNFLKEKLGNIKVGFSGLSEGAVIALFASKEVENSFIIPVSLSIIPYTVERLMQGIVSDSDGNEEEVFLCELWFDFFDLQKIDRDKIDNFIIKNGEGPWSKIIENLDKPLSNQERYNLTLQSYNEQKEKYGDYQYMDYFINDVIDNDLDLNGFIKNLELWKEFISFDVREYIDGQKAFVIWGEEDDEIDVTYEHQLCKNILPNDTSYKVYSGLGHGLCNDNGYSEKMYKDIKDWILTI